MLGTYRRLFTIPGLPRLLSWSLLGRLHFPGTPLAMTFLVAGWTGSYVASGVVAGGYSVGMAVGGPARGRSADRGDPVRLLLVISAVYAAGLAAVALLPEVLPARLWPVVAVLAFAVGLAQPPVIQIGRAAFARLIVDSDTRQSVYTVEATMQESTWVVGPVLVAAVVGAVDARAGVLLCAGLAFVGPAGFAYALHRVGLRAPAERAGGAGGPLLRARGLRPALMMSLCMFAPLAAVDMAIVAWSRDSGLPAVAGVLVAVWSAGSAVGGLVMGGRPGEARLGLRTLLMALGLVALIPVLPPVTPGSPWLIGVVLAVGGAAVAPALAANNHRIGELAPAGRTAEVFGWVMAASTLGSSLYLPVAGWLLDHGGPAATAAGSAVIAGTAAALSQAVPVPGRGPVLA
ncbi:MFS transporter [Actinokineospora enzanensis]|uniref:MFS transporter n=1 Tax=Actinokineospora enzanensis TaxID=155975 RepID=UPI000525C8CA|nr:MFS transporter [Actinokineospora enzanensis]